MANIVTVGGKEYAIEKMNARKQFHLARKLLSIMGPLAATALAGHDKADDMIMPLAKAIAELPDEDADQILDTCLETLKRNDNNHWLPVMTNHQIRYDDIGLQEMIQLAMAVIQENLSSFLTLLPSAAGQEPQ